jgi:hypothetical protein
MAVRVGINGFGRIGRLVFRAAMESKRKDIEFVAKSGDALLAELDALGDRRSRFLVEEYVPGEVLHVDGLVSDGRVVFARAARYATPPFDVAHGGGLFASTSVPPGSAGERELLDANVAIMDALGAPAGAMHTELIRAESDGRLVFLETAARVGGAHIADMVEAASGARRGAHGGCRTVRPKPAEAPARGRRVRHEPAAHVRHHAHG